MSDEIERGIPEGVPDTPPVDSLERAAVVSQVISENVELRESNTKLEEFQKRQLRRNRRVNLTIVTLALVAIAAVVIAAIVVGRLGTIEKLTKAGRENAERVNCRTPRFDRQGAARDQAFIDLLSSNANIREATNGVLVQPTPAELEAHAREILDSTANIQPDVLLRECGKAK